MTIKYNYFDISDFDCTHSGENSMSVDFVMDLDELRSRCAFPFVVTSGFRSPYHPNEIYKDQGGTHTMGIAADIAITSGDRRMTIISEALKMGFTGIGVAKTFVHLDQRAGTPVIWSY